MTKKIEYTTTEARVRREQIRTHCLGEAIREVPHGMRNPNTVLTEILNAAKAFEVYITTGKIKTK